MVETSDRLLLAKATKLLEALIEPHDEPTGGEDHEECRRCLAREELEYDSSTPMFVALVAAIRRLSVAEERRCETCRFADAPKRRYSYHPDAPIDSRPCRLLGSAGVGSYGYQLVPLVNADGEPHGCNSWRAKDAAK